MSTIQRAAWLAFTNDVISSFVVNEPGSLEFWRKNGLRVSAVVEVQPVLDALMKASEGNEDGNDLGFDPDQIWAIIDQLEKAAQP